MSKVNRKLSRKVKNMNSEKELAVFTRKIHDFEQNSDYAEVINTLGEVVEKYPDAVTTDMMFSAANAYYMLGDYQRAANWVNNTLTSQPDHVEARMLLGRLLLMEDRADDCMAIFEFLLTNMENQLTGENKEDMQDMLAYYAQYEAENIAKNYPLLYQLLTGEEADKAESVELADETAGNDADSALLRLKNLINNAADAETELEEAEEAEVCEPAEQCVTEGAPLAEVEKTIAEIANKEVPAMEKVRLYNSFAGAYYFAGDYEASLSMLEEAMSLSNDDSTLKNVAILLYDMGDKEKALAIAGKLSQADFSLLRLLRD